MSNPVAPMTSAQLAALRKRADERHALVVALMKAKERRFSGEPITGFGNLPRSKK